MVTQQSVPVLTLRYGDVEFTLIPSHGQGPVGQATFEPLLAAVPRPPGRDDDDDDDDDPEEEQEGVLWRLVNFTGTLRVVPASSDSSDPLSAPPAPTGASTSREQQEAATTGPFTGPTPPGAPPPPPSSPEAPSPPPSQSLLSPPDPVDDKENPIHSSSNVTRTSSSVTWPPIPPRRQGGSSKAAVVSTHKKNNKEERAMMSGSGSGARSKVEARGPKKAAAGSSKSSFGSNKRSLSPNKWDADDEKTTIDRSKKSRSNFFFAPSKQRTTTSRGAAAERESFTGAAGNEVDEREEDSQLTTMLGQDEDDSRPFPLSQEDEPATSSSNNSRSEAAADGVGDAMSSESAVEIIATKQGRVSSSSSERRRADEDPSRNDNTIQDIMETAQSQASAGGVGIGGAWTADEGEESNRSFPTQDSSMVVEDDNAGAEKSDLFLPSTTAVVEASSGTNVPRVSLGDSPPKVGPHDSSIIDPLAAHEEEWVVEPPTQREPPLVPCPRWGHTFTSIGNHKFVLYGGQTLVVAAADDDNAPMVPTTLNDVMVYDASNKSWFQPYNSQALHRQWHTSTYVPERKLLVAFGGESCTSSSKSSKKSLKPGKVKTSDVLTVLDTDLMLWYPPIVTGDIPSARSGHTATLVDKTNIVVFGGVKGSKWINTLYVLDVDQWNWTQPKVQGVPPKPRSYHSATALSDNRIVVFGGNDAESSFNSVHVLQKVVDEENDNEESAHNISEAHQAAGGGVRTCWRWTNPTCRGTLPSPRTGHTATLLSDQRTICIFGGWDPNAEESSDAPTSAVVGEDDSHMFSNDSSCCYLLDTTNWTWRKGGTVRYASDLPLASVHSAVDGGPRRSGHAAAEQSDENNQVLVFGGRVPGDAFAGDFQYLSGF